MKLSSPIQTLRKSIEIFFQKKNMINFVKLYLPLVPFTFFSIYQNLYIKDVDSLRSFTTQPYVIAINIIYLVIYIWIWIAGVLAIGKVTRNEELEISNTYKKAWGMVWKFSLLSLLLVLIMLFGGVLLIFPAIILGIWYSFSKFIYIEDDIGILRSLGRSKNLVTGKFWAILGRYIVFGLFTGLFGIVLAMLPFGIGGIITTVFGALFVLPYYLLYLELKEKV